MRSSFVFIFVVICVAASYVLTMRLSGGHNTGIPSDAGLRLEPASAEFGHTATGAYKEISFQISSIDGKRRRLLGFETHCSCSEIVLPEYVDPLQPAECRLRFLTPSVAGPFHRDLKLLVELDGGEHRAITLSVTGIARATASLAVFPRSVQIDPLTHTGTIYVYGPEALVEKLPASIEISGQPAHTVLCGALQETDGNKHITRKIKISADTSTALRGETSIVLVSRDDRSTLADVRVLLSHAARYGDYPGETCNKNEKTVCGLQIVFENSGCTGTMLSADHYYTLGGCN